MFDEIRYRWTLRKHLKAQHALYRAYDETPVDDEDADVSPRRGMKNDLIYQTQATDYFRSKHLVEKAYRYHMPIPHDDESWIQPSGAPERFLTTAAAQKLRADIRAEQKAEWDYWANRVTLALALFGSMLGVFNLFK
ncbi:hypothetical protein UP10_28495 [Bradyrhizobium sp. LTSPM299]|uniref:hypothetical protein n=1 Tax=Bradyrhizobium sp. LTSPM299 TaxID=1619233 RepID=UPI0005C8AFE9|nr:hypothetical protein [Bradyrhizobium sp. LTSPM299]KJC57523.1 hypothetical protein UP10_28495 [Bradyrhizobium sp. LTSPM299]